jgi:hypothetical protein
VKAFMKIVLLAVIATLFVGSSGVAIYQHQCSMSGDETSYFVEMNRACEDVEIEMVHQKKEPTQNTCCFVDDQTSEQTCLECCSTDFQFIQLQTDLIQHHAEGLESIVFVSTQPFLSSTPIKTWTSVQWTTLRGPPILKQNTRRALHQLYLI